MSDTTAIWYVHVDDETESGRPLTATREAWESVFRVMPDGSSLYPFKSAGTVGVAIPNSEIGRVEEVDAAFLAAGYKRDPGAPDSNS